MIENRQYVLNSDWGDVQPKAAAENAYLELNVTTSAVNPISTPDRGATTCAFGDIAPMRGGALASCPAAA